MAVTGSGRRTRRIAIKREALSALLTTMVGDTYAGNASAAAKAARIKQQTFSALVHRERDAVYARTYDALINFAGPRRDDMEACFLNPAASALLAIESRLSEERWEAYLTRGFHFADEALLGKALREEKTRRANAFDGLVEHVRRKYASYCNAFERDIVALGHSEAQIRTGYLEILDPLLPEVSSGGIARSWDELSEDDFREFLEAGFKRQRILLRRSPDRSRAQQRAEIVGEISPVLAHAIISRPAAPLTARVR
jgi:hypothetical protein